MSSDQRITLIAAIIGAAGAVFAGILASLVTYRLTRRSISDKEQFLKWQIAFNRGAFRGPYQMHSAPQPFLDALDDTIQAIRTGVQVTRRGIETPERGKGLTGLKNKALRSQMEHVVRRLEGIRQEVRQQVDHQPIGPDFATHIDLERDAVVRTMNEMWAKLGIDGLPLPSEVGEYQRVFGE